MKQSREPGRQGSVRQGTVPVTFPQEWSSRFPAVTHAIVYAFLNFAQGGDLGLDGNDLFPFPTNLYITTGNI